MNPARYLVGCLYYRPGALNEQNALHVPMGEFLASAKPERLKCFVGGRRLVTIYSPTTDEQVEEIAAVASEATSVEVVIDEEGLLSAAEPKVVKRLKRDDTLGKYFFSTLVN